MVGLKETPEDVSFALSSVPQPSSTSADSVVPEPRPLLREARDTVGDEASTERKGRHEIRRLVTKLSEETKAAALLEAERRERVKRERLKVTYLLTITAKVNFLPVQQNAMQYKTKKYDTM